MEETARTDVAEEAWPEEEPRRNVFSRLAAVDTWWVLVLAVLALIAGLVRGKPEPYAEIVTFLADGILVTLRLSVVSFGFILLVGLLGGLGRLSGNPLIKGVASLYVEIIRGIPLLVQLLFI
ncbi:MAG: ABC transporter permease subunit, partial [Anaerolineae bacterium]|nr:ABC transporter permease subunit [Anaerolineae bacterium]